jgi:cell division protein ZapE
MHGVARLVERQPTVSPQRLVAQLTPPPAFADASFATYHPDPAEPTPSASVEACRRFCERAVERRGFGVGKTHLLAAAYRQLPDGAARPKAFATFMEITQLAGVFGFTECVDMLGTRCCASTSSSSMIRATPR